MSANVPVNQVTDLHPDYLKIGETGQSYNKFMYRM